MSKSVTIPMSDHPLRVCVNGVWYEYKAGATVTVPDEVAAVIEEYIGAVPKPAEEPGSKGQVWTRTDDGADWVDLPATPKELPEVGEEDEGKVLTVGKVADPSVVILPEQTVECDDGWYFPTGGDPSTLEDGMKVCITVNGESVVSTVMVSSVGVVGISFPPVVEGGLQYEEIDGWSFWDDGYYEGEPITISVTGTKLGWEAESVGGAYDAILSLYHDNNSASGTEVTIEKGDYDSLVEILDSKRTPVLFVKIWDELAHLYANTSVTAVYTYNSDYIDFRVAMPADIQFDFITLKWKPNNTFVIT